MTKIYLDDPMHLVTEVVELAAIVWLVWDRLFGRRRRDGDGERRTDGDGDDAA